MGRTCSTYRVLQKCIQSFSGKRLLGRQRCRWENNVKMDLREVGSNAGDWIDVAQDKDQWWAYVRAVMNLRVP